MDKKKLIITGLRGLTVASFLAASTLPHLSFAGEETKEAKKVEGKKGSCASGSCGAMKEKKEAKETKTKEGSCSGMKDKGEKKDEKESGKKGSCTAMK